MAHSWKFTMLLQQAMHTKPFEITPVDNRHEMTTPTSSARRPYVYASGTQRQEQASTRGHNCKSKHNSDWQTLRDHAKTVPIVSLLIVPLLEIR